MFPPGNFLTESRLEDKLKIIFPNYEFIRDKIIPNSGLRYRPDFRCDELKLIVEFDGPQHYTSARNCLLDIQKDLLYSNLGYRVVRIPNFIQLDTETIKILFDKDIDMELEFPHGFISKNVIPPADYCELGIERFLKEVKKFGPKIQEDISKSLKAKIGEYGTWKAVVNSKTKWLIN
jgi:very-short-patch-repair endonuclease